MAKESRVIVREADLTVELAEGLKGNEWESVCEWLGDKLKSKWLGEMPGSGGWFWQAWLLEKPKREGSRLWLGLTDDRGGQFVLSWSWAWEDGKWALKFHRELKGMEVWDRIRIDQASVEGVLVRVIPLLLRVQVATGSKIAAWLEELVEREPVWRQDLNVREGLRVVGIPHTTSLMKQFWARLIVGDAWARQFLRLEGKDGDL